MSGQVEKDILLASSMVSIKDRLLGREGRGGRQSIRDEVLLVLEELGIDTDLEPYIEKLTNEFMAPTEPRVEIGWDHNGPVGFDFRGHPGKSREDALFAAREIAPAGLRRSVRLQLEERGVDKRRARIVAAVVRGENVKEIAGDEGVSPQTVYNEIAAFRGTSW